MENQSEEERATECPTGVISILAVVAGIGAVIFAWWLGGVRW